MGKIVRKTEFVTVSLVQVEHKEINKELAHDMTSQYLAENHIDGSNYKLKSLEYEGNLVKVHLMRVGENLYNNGYIDEDFSDDLEWEDFCGKMAENLEVRRFAVPWYYYPK